MIIWLTYNFIGFGITLVLPTAIHKVFAQANSSPGMEYAYLAGITLIEILLNYVTPLIMNHPQLGRHKTVEWTLGIVALVSSLTVAFGSTSLTAILVLVAMLKAANTIGLMVTMH